MTDKSRIAEIICNDDSFCNYIEDHDSYFCDECNCYHCEEEVEN